MDKNGIFTKRQKEILQCLSQRMSNKDIAAALGVSINTVRVHLWLLCQKMGVRSRWQALDMARQQGFFEEANTSMFLEAIAEERSKLTHEMYAYIKSLKSLSPEDRRKQARLVTMYDMIFDGSYNYPSL